MGEHGEFGDPDYNTYGGHDGSKSVYLYRASIHVSGPRMQKSI